MTTALEAARLGDEIGHTSAMKGLLIGLAVGFVAAVAVVAIVGTGGVAAVAIGGIIAGTAGGGLAGMNYGATCDTGPIGPIITGSPNTFLGASRKAAARATIDKVLCQNHSEKLIAQGSIDIFINLKPAARKTDATVCSGKIREGQVDVFFGGETGTYLEMEEEVPRWLVVGLQVAMWIGVGIATAGAAFSVGIGAALGGLGGGLIGGWVGGKIGGAIGGIFGERGRMIGEMAGGFIGGIFGGSVGARGGARVEARLPQSTLARLPGATPAHIKARMNVARDFYNESPNFQVKGAPDTARIESHMSGIDFSRPLSVRTIQRPTTFTQYQNPGGRVGNYIAEAGTPADRLGIGPIGRNPAKVDTPKVIQQYEVPAGTRVLTSTASPKNDTWSAGMGQPSRGGGQQSFIGDSGVMKPIGGQQAADAALLRPGRPFEIATPTPGQMPVRGDGVFVAPNVGAIGSNTGAAGAGATTPNRGP
jgi:uncharacterized Zn-binding protein involved in type VI secretion